MTKNRGLAKTPHMAAQKHFWAMVLKADRSTGCWLWPFATNDGRGYGYVSGTVVGRTNPVLVHRAAYLVTHPGAPTPSVVRHRCDTPRCFNPSHLEPGTPLDNARDATVRGRRAIGERHPFAKLTEASVRELLHLHGTGVEAQALADRFGISKGHVQRICRGEQWQHVGTEGAA